LKKTLDRHNIKLAFKTTNKVRNILQNNTRVNGKFDRPGVYRIGCKDCNSVYIGQTGRTFKTRFKEHRPDPRTTHQKSSFSQHLVDLGDIGTSLDILHVCSKGRKLVTLEELEIYRHFQENHNTILNEKLKFSSHVIFNSITGHEARLLSDSQPPPITTHQTAALRGSADNT